MGLDRGLRPGFVGGAEPESGGQYRLFQAGEVPFCMSAAVTALSSPWRATVSGPGTAVEPLSGRMAGCWG